MIAPYWNQIVSFIENHKRGTFLILLLSLLIISTLITFFVLQNKKVQTGYTPSSSVVTEEGRSVFSLTTNRNYLYKAGGKDGKSAALEFINENPKFGDSRLLPQDFSKNTEITREEIDKNDPFLRNNNIVLTNEHYFFNQKIDNIPVYNANVAVHVRNTNEIYAVTGSLSIDSRRTAQQISEEEAVKNALVEAQKETLTNELSVRGTTKFYINEKLIGLSDDTTNKLALKVEIESAGVPVLFKTDYYVSLTDGTILYSETQTRDALNRNIHDCKGGSCSLARSETGSAASDPEVNSLYTYFGNVYEFFSTTFGRDSYDGNGSPLNGYVNAPTGLTVGGATMKCPNAFWNGYEMVFCTGLVLPDVTGHELSHGIISRTANLQYMRQSGALNESIADIFGSEIDKNWEIGEGVRPGSGLPVPLRSMSSPPAQGNPDKLSSSLYHCAPSDNGGVHRNSGVINKTYYLMVDGGAFNGCSINGIGRDKAVKVVYQALTKYLTATSNFKEVYTSFTQSCTDIFGATSAECQNIDRAMQATELDQQPAGLVISPICQGSTLKPATCASSGGAPTVPPSTPGPTGTSPTGTTGGPTPTPVVGSSGSWKISVTPICEGSKAHLKIDYEISSAFGGVFKTINAAGSATGIEDMSYIKGTFGSPVSGMGTYISKGNFSAGSIITPAGLKKNYRYTIEVHTAEETVVPSLIFSLNITTADCSASPAPTIPGGSGVTGTPTPTPTPRQMFKCLPDPKCVSSGKSIQLCPLVCQPVSLDTGQPKSPGSIPTATSVPATNPTSAVPTVSSSTPTTPVTPTSTGPDIASIVNSVSEVSIRSFMQNLVDDDEIAGIDESQTRYSGSQGLVTETNFVNSKFSEFGLSSSFQNFSFGSTNTRNVIGRIEGQDPNSVYLVTSHIDTTAQMSGKTDPAPGADDNASGTVAVMEAARVLKALQPKLKYSLEFVAFSGEEQGLFGSYYYVSNLAGGKKLKG